MTNSRLHITLLTASSISQSAVSAVGQSTTSRRVNAQTTTKAKLLPNPIF